ncbi:MAG TPA: cytidylate kinase-like family protein [Verrucomicrobiae bacterium]|nr:cytidylate kinase-like family protein [Verrucomicrobiae bacterium]
MNTNIAFDGSRSLVASQFYVKTPDGAHVPRFGPAITISQQTGSGAHDIAERLAGMLQQSEPDHLAQWSVFDRQLVLKALEEHQWPARIERYMAEDRRSYVQDVMDELFGLRPPSWVLVPQIAETIMRLVKTGHVILVGRGSVAVATDLPGVFHVRLVASLPKRINRIKSVFNFNAEDAVKYIRREDRGSRRYTQAHFHANLDNDLLYHLVINTDRIPYSEAALLIAAEARKAFARDGDSYDKIGD